jgi:hypothetical protein
MKLFFERDAVNKCEQQHPLRLMISAIYYLIYTCTSNVLYRTFDTAAAPVREQLLAGVALSPANRRARMRW